jgi:hypothetical protein
MVRYQDQKVVRITRNWFLIVEFKTEILHLM